ncbi:hypothetical protein COT40_02230 [Candidatus Peregrinibacteria bacterium CG08_land_8_20_14_0_20_41_10]|nr:MAG: hypothetical protein AUJ78_01185 [Candidatus Peregrinibacteria bacterium CG1_02_41_10]PIS32032.1 MAG: hypothetical protein COT40_02230 [Candidatus Peregrinibacteria bacterium CG08_land_8_20_14_0_20_41_10]
MERRFLILKAIVESFVLSAQPVSSKYLRAKFDLDVSPATIRNEMAFLEKMGLVFHPHTSAGRIPTEQGFRMFVDELMEKPATVFQQRQKAIAELHKLATEERLRQVVALLARVCNNVSFAVLPDKKKTYYLGLANMLQKPEFQRALEAYSVVKILEDPYAFAELLKSLPIDEKIRVFLGRENIIPEISSCGMIVTTYQVSGYGNGYLGILGPMRMNYAYNIGALEHVKESLC